MYNFTIFKQELADAGEHLRKELSGVRTGRAAPALLDGVHVTAYGSQMPLTQVAGIHAEDVKTVRVNPWDAGLVKAIEKAITDANLGVSVGADDAGVRVTFPELTSERREELVRVVGKKLEEARIAVRQLREHAWSDIQKMEKEGKMSEDEKFRAKDEMQKHVDVANASLEECARRKEEELRN